MWRHFRKNLLLGLIVMLVAGGFLGAMMFGIHQYYRSESNAELARLVGAIAEEYPDVDSAEIIRTFSSSGTQSEVIGTELLRAYGYTDADFAAPSTERYAFITIVTSLSVILGIIIIFVGYLCYRNVRDRTQIKNLVQYVQKLNDQIYDLRIETNTEDELSLLSNELYKVTVTLKEAAEHDRLARRHLETALADISHQLKTPLTSLQVVLDNLESDPDMAQDVRQDFLRSASHQVIAMTSLVTTLLHLAKFDNGTIKMQRRIMEIHTILESVRDKLEVLADLQGVKIKITGDLAAQVKLDPRWQVEALANIVKNCIEHSSKNSIVTLHITDSTIYTRVTISDTGTGIAPHDLRHIFERFYKADNTNPSSVGIGLAFAKSIIETDNGQIRVKSTPGVGSTFTVTYFH